MNSSLSLNPLSAEFEGVVYYEEWVPVKEPVDFSDIYEVSSFGRVKKKRHQLKNGKWKEEKIIKVCANVKRYLRVSLRHNGRKLGISLHRLVCTHFHDNPENKPQVNHKDNNKKNSYAYNLEWATQSENIQHAQSIGVMAYAKPKSNNPKRKPGKPKGCPGIFKKVINIDTNEIYQSAEEVSALTGIKFRSLRRALSGERYNKTPYRYFVKGEVVNSVRLPPPVIIKTDLVGKFNSNGDLIEMLDLLKIKDNILKQRIGAFLNGRSSSVDGFFYKKSKDGSFIEPPKFISKRKVVIRTGEVPDAKPIIKYSLDGKELQRYPSVLYVAKEFGVEKRNARKAISKSPRGYYKGYIFKYA